MLWPLSPSPGLSHPPHIMSLPPSLLFPQIRVDAQTQRPFYPKWGRNEETQLFQEEAEMLPTREFLQFCKTEIRVLGEFD